MLTSSPAYTYQWQLNTVDIPGATSQSYNVMQSGLYTVIVADSNGCVNSANQNVLISGIVEVSDATISIYPNPSSGIFMVEFSDAKALENKWLQIKIENMLGQEVFSSTDKIYSPSFKKEIDLTGFSDGVYYITLKSENLSLKKKIMIAR
jgi:hypothetical protein